MFLLVCRRYLPKSNLVFKTNNNIITHHSFLPKQIIYKLQSSSYCTESNNKNKPTDINNNNIQQSNPPFVNPSNQPQQTNVNNNNNITKNETIKSEEINKSDNVVVEKDFSDSWKDFKRLMALARPETKNILCMLFILLFHHFLILLLIILQWLLDVCWYLHLLQWYIFFFSLFSFFSFVSFDPLFFAFFVLHVFI